MSDANFWCNASALEPDENHVLHSRLDAILRTDVGPCPDAISRRDSGWEDKLLVDGFSNVPYIPPLDPHVDAIPNYHVIAANLRADLPSDYELDPDPDYVEVHYADYMWRTIPDVPREPEPEEAVIERIYLGKPGKRIVNVERDDDLLTPEEVKLHEDEVKAAMLKELVTWAKHKCFSRRSRQDARNIIDCRWVLKWKWEEETLSIADSASG